MEEEWQKKLLETAKKDFSDAVFKITYAQRRLRDLANLIVVISMQIQEPIEEKYALAAGKTVKRGKVMTRREAGKVEE